jgi:hypothetical protein
MQQTYYTKASNRTPGNQRLARAGAPLDRSPYSVVEEPPTIGRGVPHQVRLGRPRRWRWLRRRPRRRGSPGSPADWPTLIRDSRTLPVVAVIPVPVVAPARVPVITWAPVIAGPRDRRRLGPGVGAASQSESRQRQRASRQRAGIKAKPRSRLLHSRSLRSQTFIRVGTQPRRRRPLRSPYLQSGPCRPPWPPPSTRRRSGRHRTRSRL